MTATIKTRVATLKPASCNGATYSEIDGGGELREQINEIDAELEQLAERTERCRKLDLTSKGAITTGGALIFLAIVGVIRPDPAVMIGAIAAVIGGIVVFGSNRSTLRQTTRAMDAAKARRARLILAPEADGSMLQMK